MNGMMESRDGGGREGIVGEVPDVGDSAEAPRQLPLAIQGRVLSALPILVDDAEVANGEKGRLRRPPPKIAVLRPAALRVVLAAQCQIHAPVDGPKIALPDHRALAGGTAKMGDQESRLMRLFGQWVSGERQIEHWHAVDPKTAVVDARLAGYFNRHPGRVKLPLRLRQLASGDGPIVDDEPSRSALFH